MVHKRGLDIDAAFGRFDNRHLHQETVLLCQRKHDETNVYAIFTAVLLLLLDRSSRMTSRVED
jgi:hypothetical protein